MGVGVTEDEAKTKWCAFATIYERTGRQTNGAPWAAAMCIGSACMAWRWTKAPEPERAETKETGTDIPRVKIAPPNLNGWIATKAGRDKPDRPDEAPYRWVEWERTIPAISGEGFCGLAGKPD